MWTNYNTNSEVIFLSFIWFTDDAESGNERKKQKKKKEKKVTADIEQPRIEIVKSTKKKHQKSLSDAKAVEKVSRDNKESDSGLDTGTRNEMKKKKKKHKKEFLSESTMQDGVEETAENDPQTSSKKKKDKKNKSKEGDSVKVSSDRTFVNLEERSAKTKSKSSRQEKKKVKQNMSITKDGKCEEAKRMGSPPSGSIKLTNEKVADSMKKKSQAGEQNQKDKTSLDIPVGQRLLEISKASKVSLNPHSAGKSKGHIRFSSSDESSSDSDSRSESSSSSGPDTKKTSSTAVTRTPLIPSKHQIEDGTVSSAAIGQSASSPSKLASNMISNNVNKESNLPGDTQSNYVKDASMLNGSHDGESYMDRSVEEGSWPKRTQQQANRGRKRRIGRVENKFSKIAQLNTQLSNKSLVIQVSIVSISYLYICAIHLGLLLLLMFCLFVCLFF